MQVRWYGQSAFALVGGDSTVFIDPFGDMESARARGLTGKQVGIWRTIDRGGRVVKETDFSSRPVGL